MAKATKTHKLGDIKEQLPEALPHFTMQRRMPGWHSDAGDNQGTRKDLYLQETLRVDSNGKFEHFPVPRSNGVPFLELVFYVAELMRLSCFSHKESSIGR